MEQNNNQNQNQNDDRSTLKKLRKQMMQHNIDVYIVPTDDFHLSEYVGDFFKAREFMSGFTGSAGTLIVSQSEAGLWTDGRYFIQAEKELQNSGIQLYKAGNEGVPSIRIYLSSLLQGSGVLGFDGRCMPAELGEEYEELAGQVVYELDLVGECWEYRPAISKEPAYVLPEKYSGRSCQEKIQCVRNEMKAAGAEYFLLAALDEIAWLLNIRGNDVAYNPVVLSYMLISDQQIVLYCFSETISGISDYLQKNGIVLRDYYQIYDDIKNLEAGTRVLADRKRLNYSFYKNLKQVNVCLICKDNPTYLLKAIKNDIEIKNEKIAHVKDGVAYVRFLYWFRQNLGSGLMDEKSVAERLRKERENMEHFVEESFESISAYNAHGAIVHYGVTEESNVPVLPEGLLLLDTGGHYLEGTTDVTRTLVCGSITEEQKYLYTAVLRGNLNLGAAIFLEGTNGCNLDILARQPLWELGLDYKHGTGHGVGYLLNVHEGPQSICWRMNGCQTPLQPGMIVSNEPGVYMEGKFGIRLENLLLCKPVVNTPRSQNLKEYRSTDSFLEWETLTLVPFEREAIIPELLTERERRWLNTYHQRVYQELQPYLSVEETKFLKDYTAEL